jgi:hypothetical protein
MSCFVLRIPHGDANRFVAHARRDRQLMMLKRTNEHRRQTTTNQRILSKIRSMSHHSIGVRAKVTVDDDGGDVSSAVVVAVANDTCQSCQQLCIVSRIICFIERFTIATNERTNA